MGYALTPGVALAPLTTFRLGGSAEWFAEARTPEEVRAAVREAKLLNAQVMALGGGSNILLPDAGVRGLVVRIAIPGIDFRADGDGVIATAGAGVAWDAFVASCVAEGWWGVENLSAIPGTVGGTPIQNVGAYGAAVGDTLYSVEVYDPDADRFITLSRDACRFGYRDSAFKRELSQLVITRVQFRLSRVPCPHLAYRDLADHFAGTETPSLGDIRAAVTAIRSRKFPDLRAVGCAGSTFKNPSVSAAQYADLQRMFPELPGHLQGTTVKIPLAYLLERLGWKGFREGDAGVWPGHALVVVNYGTATGAEIRALIKRIAHDVHARTGVAIEPEILIIE